MGRVVPGTDWRMEGGVDRPGGVSGRGMSSPWLGAAVDADPLERARLLRKAHELVLSGHPRPPILRDVVLKSWRRCARAGVDPGRPAPRMVGEEEAAARLRRHSLAKVLPLLRSTLGSVTEDARHIVVLSDADGLLLWAEGHPRMMDAAAATHFLPGGLCSEAAAGTNAVGTALALDHPVQIFSAEHYSSLFHGWTCSAAPIHDPTTGAVLGALDVSANFRTAHPHTLSLVTAVALAAESQLSMQAARHDERLRSRYLSLVTRSADRPSALVTRSGRMLTSNPPGWLSEPLTVPADGGRFALSTGDEVVAEQLESGEAFLIWKADRGSARPPQARLRVEALGRERASLHQRGGTVELSPRHSEILTLLVLHPEGVNSENLAGEIYGSNAKSVTIRAEMSRLRRLLGCLLVSNPYRLVADVQADFLDVERLLDERDFEAAARRYGGPLMAGSRVPDIVATRERIEHRLDASAGLAGDLEPVVEPTRSGPGLLVSRG